MAIVSAFSLAGFFYSILAMQVSSGFPAFYEKFSGKLEDEIRPLMPFVFALIVLLSISAIIPQVFLLFGFVSAWTGWRVRQSVQDRVQGPQAWLLNPLTMTAFSRWPMLPFDIWTLGMIVLTTTIIVSVA